ncbi:MAG: hypothetical protein KDK96_09815 [Chlamydiia bacterium]|nr:hypothetical protein [Chlamydiia bacterium]
MHILKQTSSEATSEVYQKGMQETYDFTEKLLLLLTQFRLEYESSFLNNLPLKISQAIYAYYDGRVELHVEAHGHRFADVLKVILEKCPADTLGREPTFEGTLRANFLELALPVWEDSRVFSSQDKLTLKSLIGTEFRSTPQHVITRDELPASSTPPFEKLQGRYPDDPDLIVKFNGSCFTIQELYNGTKTPCDADVNFYEIMMLVLEHCPSTVSGEKTLRLEIRVCFISLFNTHKDQVSWQEGERAAIEQLLSAREAQVQPHRFGKKQMGDTPRSGERSMCWTPLWVISGLMFAFLTYRYVVPPVLQWIRKPDVPVQQKV